MRQATDANEEGREGKVKDQPDTDEFVTGSRDAPLVEAVLEELKRLASSRGGFHPARLADFPLLYGLGSQPSLNDAALWLETAVRRRAKDRYITAAAMTAFGQGADVLGRLSDAGEELGRDQRTIREWSYRGMSRLAEALVEASFLWGSRAMHTVTLDWGKAPDRENEAVLLVYWRGHAGLVGESIFVYLIEDGDADPPFKLLKEVRPSWQPVENARGSFTHHAGVNIRVGHPKNTGIMTFMLKFGTQSTQLVNIVTTPRFKGFRTKVAVFRSGVTYYFEELESAPVDPNIKFEVLEDRFLAGPIDDRMTTYAGDEQGKNGGAEEV